MLKNTRPLRPIYRTSSPLGAAQGDCWAAPNGQNYDRWEQLQQSLGAAPTITKTEKAKKKPKKEENKKEIKRIVSPYWTDAYYSESTEIPLMGISVYITLNIHIHICICIYVTWVRVRVLVRHRCRAISKFLTRDTAIYIYRLGSRSGPDPDSTQVQINFNKWTKIDSVKVDRVQNVDKLDPGALTKFDT